MSEDSGINPNQSYCGDWIGTIKPRKGYGSLGILRVYIVYIYIPNYMNG